MESLLDDELVLLEESEDEFDDESAELPVWRRSGFWTTSLERLDLTELQTSVAEQSVPDVVTRTPPSMVGLTLTLYVALYLGDKPTFRSVVWSCALACNVLIFFMPWWAGR